MTSTEPMLVVWHFVSQYAFLFPQAYHSDVSVTLKESIHRSWMRNETQVVVATIAFGLGYVPQVNVAFLFLS
jgi:superfamily II DNA helicase RecQ